MVQPTATLGVAGWLNYRHIQGCCFDSNSIPTSPQVLKSIMKMIQKRNKIRNVCAISYPSQNHQVLYNLRKSTTPFILSNVKTFQRKRKKDHQRLHVHQ